MTAELVGQEPLPREERRKRSEAAILHAAREQFAALGFDRTTIRSVASQAQVDPALVMQYFRNKEGLFSAAARWQLDTDCLGAGAGLVETALEAVLRDFEDTECHSAGVALLRNCLTHETAMRLVRDDVLGEVQARIAHSIQGSDAELRAALLTTLLMGLVVGRYLFKIPALAQATTAEIEARFGPALECLVGFASSP